MKTRHAVSILVVVAAIAMFPANAWADTIIVVKVVDEAGNPVSGADIVITDKAGKVIKGKSGGKKGEFRTFWIGQNAGEEFTITVTKGNKKGKTKTKCAEAPKKTKAKVTLKAAKQEGRFHFGGEAFRRGERMNGRVFVPFAREREETTTVESRLPGRELELADGTDKIVVTPNQIRVDSASRVREQAEVDADLLLQESLAADSSGFRSMYQESAARSRLISALAASNCTARNQACRPSAVPQNEDVEGRDDAKEESQRPVEDGS